MITLHWLLLAAILAFASLVGMALGFAVAAFTEAASRRDEVMHEQ